MKKLLSLLSVLTISGVAIPTTIAASPYKKQETKLENNEINYSQINNLKNLNRSKRDFYEKEQIEFFNNDFFYKFNVKYDSGEKSHGSGGGFQSVMGSDFKILINDWTKYAKTWEDFQQKFPELEFIDFRAEMLLHGKNLIEKKLKISTSLIKELRKENIFDSKWNEPIRWISSKNNMGHSNHYSDEYNAVKHIFKEHYSTGTSNGISGFFNSNGGVELAIRIYRENNKIMIQNCYYVGSSSFKSPWVKIKYDSIRLIGKIDVNPLFSLTFEKAKQFDIWTNSKEAELQTKRKDKNYNQDTLIKEEATFKEEFKLWLLQIRHDYIQDLINIDQNNDITALKSEIDNIKSRLDELERKKTCLDNIFNSFKKNTLANAPGNALKSIKKNIESPLKIIIKKSGEAFAQGILMGAAKGSALGIISCVAESIL